MEVIKDDWLVVGGRGRGVLAWAGPSREELVSSDDDSISRAASALSVSIILYYFHLIPNFKSFDDHLHLA